MNTNEIKSTVKQLTETCECLSCKTKYKENKINVIATTKKEGLFEMHCDKCHSTSLVTVMINKITQLEGQRQHSKIESISKNDVLDMKNFLQNFDGNFKKIL
ncbi:hypothetical protein COY05_04175 [Candidatus Peregrinibacteria bacterium CG_4_10_14_0_2_um_filter_38_24]|nr:MAG: hypothetical protein COY05_04175 [Candidatus Peregrinibacteria bacterium CG_4_10_14_0_2_um_filter_38_24]PJC38552.1 MAG: hypothetical protein CO044_04400 [Candidatus Peregrinibacteria bacterium CG_4_9_14_0_2_um_filter_38_9]